MTDAVTLRDGREMAVRLAANEDADLVAAAHPLPREGQAPVRFYRNYYLGKALIYTQAPGAGIVTGWVDGQLAGFVFHCRNLDAVHQFTRRPRTVLWLLGETIRGRFGFDLSFWADAIRWGIQHFRQPADYAETDETNGTFQDIEAWVGTVHTVEQFRRLGVATHLLSFAERALTRCGAAMVALWVATDNEPAKSLYRKRGYEQSGQFTRVGERCDLMIKRLTEDPAREDWRE